MIVRLVLGILGILWLPATDAQPCGGAPVQVQVLGSSGPELADQRAQSGYLVWIEGKPRVLVDVGAAVALRFIESGASTADLDAILLTRLYADRTADLPTLLRASLAQNRSRSLPIYGPAGNKSMPSTVAFIRALFDGTRGAYRYMGELLNPLAKAPYKLQPHNVGEEANRLGVRQSPAAIYQLFSNSRLRVSAMYVTRDTAPALLWRIEAAGKSIVFSGVGDGTGKYAEALAKNADWLAVSLDPPQTTPDEIAGFAKETAAKQLVLLANAQVAPEREAEILELIKKHYAGPVGFARDLACFAP
ncbi:MAG TPA: MBL fold metallo-hydrolase [Candidatus Methylomirabilis sp.]|nr:MBL fold metallo-hydrolase [Candidatus Methylomirabilis sp.]